MNLILLSLLCFSIAEEKVKNPNPLQAMFEKNQEVKTKEGTVTINGVSYKKVEAEGKSFYFKVLQREEAIPVYLCERPEGYKSEHLIETSLKINRRKRIFFQALVEKCSTRKVDFNSGGYKGGLPASNNKRTWVEVDPIVGIHLPEGDDDLIKNKKVGIGLENLTNIKTDKIQFMGEF